MKKIVMIVGFVLCATSLALAPMALADMPGPNAKELWNYITKVSPYQEWSFWPDHQGMQPGRAPHGPFHKVYVNDILLNSPAPPVQYGSIEVKESYNKAKKLVAITVQYKVKKGYNPNDGDWFWVKYSLKGKGKPAGKVKGCIECHGTRVKNDFILVHEFK